VPVQKDPTKFAILSDALKTSEKLRSYRDAELYDRPGAATLGLSPSAPKALEAERVPMFYDREESRTVLASLVTEVHVSDENRDFMSSTHVDSKSSRRDAPTTLRVDDENENAEEPVELPPLP
jgi:hypothetical protein